MQPNTFQCTEGKHMGEIFQPHEFEALKEEAPKGLNSLEQRNKELEGERTIHLNKIKRLDDALEQARADEKIAVANADRLHDNIVHLSSECRRLERELEAGREAKKVVVPREVAEAIEDFYSDGSDVDYIIKCINIVSNATPTERLKTLKTFAANNGFILICALVNGYTVEEPAEEAKPTTEERITAALLKVLSNLGENEETDIERLSKMLMLAVREVLAEERPEQESMQ
jgi:hypothetical protein